MIVAVQTSPYSLTEVAEQRASRGCQDAKHASSDRSASPRPGARMACVTIRMLAALVVIAAALTGNTAPAQAAAPPSLWLGQPTHPATIGVAASGPQFNSGSQTCIPGYTAIDMNTRLPSTGCAAADIADDTFALGNLLSIAGAAAPVALPRSGQFVTPTPSGAWMRADCGVSQSPGCLVRLSTLAPRLLFDAQANVSSWTFPTDTGPAALGRPVRDALVDAVNISYSTDGRYLVAPTDDGTGILWYDSSAKETRKIQSSAPAGQGFPVTGPVAVSPDGRYVAVGGVQVANGGVRIFDTSGCPILTSSTTPDCISSSVTTQQLLGLSATTDLSDAVSVSFFGDDTVSFQARSANLPGGSATAYRWFRLRAPGAAAPPSPMSTLVLGDSFASGEGAGSYQSGTDVHQLFSNINMCHFSTKAWPQLLAADLGQAPDSVHSVACSGATTQNITRLTQHTDGGTPPFPGTQPQINAIGDYTPRRLIVQIGGNDADFHSVVVGCATGGDCSNPLNRRADALRVQRAYTAVANTLAALRATDPTMQIVLVGYPGIVKAGGNCGDNAHLDGAETIYASELVDYVDKAQARAAASAGAYYISLLHSIDGHRICDAQSWVNGLTAGDDTPVPGIGPLSNGSYHPTALAHKAMAQAIAVGLESLPPPDAGCEPNPCASTTTTPPPLESWADGTDNGSSWSPGLVRDPIGTITGHPGGLKPGTVVGGGYHSTLQPITPVTVDDHGFATIDAATADGLSPGWHTLQLDATAADGTALHASLPVIVPGPDGDRDGDGIPDAVDLCPGVPGGATDTVDTDGDGIGDACDAVIQAAPTLAGSASVPTTVGGTVTDTAALAGGDSPTGTVTFDVYGPGDDTCQTSLATTTVVVSGNGSYSSAPLTATRAGSFRFIASYSGDDNNQPTSPRSCDDPAQQTIADKASLTIIASDASMTYGEAPPAITATYVGLVNGDSAASLDAQATCSTDATSASVAGSAHLSTCSQASSANYEISYASGVVTIGRAPLTITAADASMATGGTTPVITPSYQGFVNADGPTVLTTAPTCTANVAARTTSCSGAATDSYAITYIAGTLTIAAAATPLTITAPKVSAPYGAPPASFIPTYTGLTAGDIAPATPPTCTTTATTTSPVGTYPIVCSGAGDPKYTITYKPGVLTIAKRKLTITAAAGTMSYGGTPPAITPLYAGFAAGQDASALTTGPACTANAPAGILAGVYPGRTACSGAISSNFTFTYVAGKLTVSKAPLTVIAPSAVIVFGTPVPAPLIATYTGLVAGDSAPATAATCSTTATTTTLPGTKPITCTGASDPDYALKYVAGVLRIIQAPTTLVALDLLMTGLHPSAVLTSRATGAAIAGQSVKIAVGAKTICTIKTDTTGTARCAATITAPSTFIATYAGSASYLSATITSGPV